MGTTLMLFAVGLAGSFVFDRFDLPGGAMTGAMIAVVIFKSCGSITAPDMTHWVRFLVYGCVGVIVGNMYNPGMLDAVRDELSTVLREAGQGALLRDGMTVVIAGRPNAGKSSLLNALAGREAAIVTDIAGTTRDVLREHIHIDGMPLHVVDTAGLRDTDDQVEKIGVERALKAISEADRVLLVVDATAPEAVDPFALWPEFLEQRPDPAKVTLIRNKADVTGEAVSLETSDDGHVTITGKDQPGLTGTVNNADGKTTTPTAVVKNIDNITQLPQTGATTMGVMLVGAFAIILVATASGFAAYRVRHENLGDGPAIA